MIEPIRLLAFAFAGADFLFEIDHGGTVQFATGAISGFSEQSDPVGHQASEMFQANEQPRFNVLVKGMSPGERMGPMPITLASGEKASLSLCFLPHCERISCTLVKPGKRGNPTGGVDKETGLVDRTGFLAAAIENTGGKATVAMVNVPNLPEICAKLSSRDAANLLAGIGTNIRSMGAIVAARLSQTRFGVLTEDPNGAAHLAEKIRSAGRDQGHNNLRVEEVMLSLDGRNLTEEQNVLALRHVIGRFADDKLVAIKSGDLTNVFETMMQETIARAQSFNATIADGAFELAFEPIVDLRTGTPKHYEALTRFQPGHSPAETIQFAEDLGLTDPFDIAVAVKAFSIFENDPAIAESIAFNISGRSIANPASFGMLAGLLENKKAYAKRVLIEVTESAEMPDLVAADKAIQNLRRMGYKVGIDDFGAGAASLQYLHGLAVDFVKVDGSLVQRLGQSKREDALLKSIIATCAELQIDTIAEWIDSDEKFKRCRDIGFRYGQGRHFGGALSELPKRVEYQLPRARRAGVKESWG